jgi:uncharacterized membrane protein YhhN
MERQRGKAWLTGYGVLTVAHLVTIAIDESLPRLLTKLALMPTLTVWARLQGGPVLLLAGLAASLVGDYLLEVDLLVPGMAAFGVAHLCYVLLFSRRTTSRSWAVLAAYGVVWLGALILLWQGLGDDRLPVAGYSLLVTATAVTSAWYGWRSGIGGLLFLISDALIGVELAGNEFTGRPYLVMALYCLAQYLLASSLTPVSRGERQ